MKWNRTVKPRLVEGEERERIRFAWIPVKCNDGHTVVWLEHYAQRELVVRQRFAIGPLAAAGAYFLTWHTVERRAQ